MSLYISTIDPRIYMIYDHPIVSVFSNQIQFLSFLVTGTMAGPGAGRDEFKFSRDGTGPDALEKSAAGRDGTT